MNKLLLEILRVGDEASLHKAQSLFEKTERLARLGYWEWDEIEDRCVFCSGGLAEIAGVSQEEYLARASSFEGDVAWAHPDDRARYRKTISQAIAARRSFQIEYRFLRPDGQIVEVYEESEPVLDRNGRLVATRGFIQDISRRKAVERALQDAQQSLEHKVRLRTAELQKANETLKREIAERHRVEADLRAHQAQLKRVHSMAKIGAFVWDDVTGRPVYYSDELAEMFGTSANELLEKRATCEQITESIDPRDRDAYNATVDRAEEICAPYTVEYRTQAPDGDVRYWRELGEPILDEQGNLLRTLVVVQDITDIRRAEEALRTSEERLKLAVDLAGLGHWIWDTTADRCLYCSEETARIHGVTPEEYLETASALDGAMPFTHPDDRERYVTAVRNVRGGETVDVEYRIVRRGGEVRHVRELIRPMSDSSGRVIQEIGTIQDITDVKAAEEQLRQAQKMEAIGQLTGGIAHDFNNLLAVIQGNAELLSESDGNREALLSGIRRAADSGAKLTQRLLAYSRQQPLSPRPIDLAEIVGSMCDLLRRTLGANIEIDTLLPRKLSRAIADRSQVENALLNLAINARDAMPRGGKLTIRCTETILDEQDPTLASAVAPGAYVVLEVGDTGSGMTAEVRERAFEPFFTTKDVGEGSGLGLSMVYGFARQSGGLATIESAPERGTTVRLYLPANDAEPVAESGRPSDAVFSGSGQSILVLEDNADLRELISSMLKGLGYRTMTAADAKEAETILLQDGPIDLLLSDVVLPGGMSGPEFVAKAKRRWPNLKVLMASGYPSDEIERHASRFVDAPLLGKPFRKAELAKVLRRTFDG